MHLLFLIAIIQIIGVRSLIVPDEIPTILSVIYSNIPVIKKGTDSRLGWGFRLGDRADFQVMVELGPQTYTQPLANQQDKNANSKRNAQKTLSDTLYAQRLKDKENRKQQIRTNIIQDREVQNSGSATPDSEGSHWLQTWSKAIKGRDEPIQEVPPGAQPGLAEGEIDAKSVIPEDESAKLSEGRESESEVKIDYDVLLAKLRKLYELKRSESSAEKKELTQE